MQHTLSIAPLALLLGSASCLACDCASSSLADRVKWSSDVYVGEIVRHAPLVSLKLRVVERFKGAARQNVTLITGRGDCDYFLRGADAQPGEQFLVFMTSSAAGNTVNRCLGTAPAAVALPDLRALRTGAYK